MNYLYKDNENNTIRVSCCKLNAPYDGAGSLVSLVENAAALSRYELVSDANMTRQIMMPILSEAKRQKLCASDLEAKLDSLFETYKLDTERNDEDN